MPYSLLTSIQETFSHELIKRAAISYAEPQYRLKKAAMAAIPVILNSLLVKLVSCQLYNVV